MYRLKEDQESFTIVEGPFAGRTFARGKLYVEIPPQEAKKFKEVKETTPEADTERPSKLSGKKGAVIDAPENSEVTP
ncbi:MAG: hypothetical protein C4549_02845 [Deltaproteobacteria bacterium]|jgi:hypothetical protein|nr:MAG: hypothetical protein C4549_02845 [Deltaproteobacteria bacterium]